MEGAGHHRGVAAEAAEPVVELAGGFASEREGEHVAGLGPAGLHAPGDTAGEDAGLAGSGSREDCERRCLARDRGALFGIEADEECVGGSGHGHRKEGSERR